MQEIARLTFNDEDSESIKKVIWEPAGRPEDVQRCRKTVILIEYFFRINRESFRNGSSTD
jgi:hypothetical protein